MYQIDFQKLPETLMFGRFVQKKGWEHSGNKITRELFVIAVGGRAQFCFENKTHTIKTGDILYIPSGTFYTASTEDSFEYYFFHFSACIKQVTDYNLPHMPHESSHTFALPRTVYNQVHIQNIMSAGEQFNQLLHLLSKCSLCALEKTPSQKMLLDLWFAQILLLLSDSAEKETPPNYPKLLVNILFYIGQNYTVPLSLSSLAEHFGVSKSYLSRIFQRHLHKTVSAYVNDVKLSHALELLKNSTMNVTEIADYLGYSSCYYFSSLFKKKYLKSPVKYIAAD